MDQDQLFNRLLQNDQVGEPDKSIEDRLMVAFMLKNSRSKLRQNSFSSFFGWAFSAESLGLKTGLVSVILFFSLMNHQINMESGKVTASDSLINSRVLVADTTAIIPSIDSTSKDSLY